MDQSKVKEIVERESPELIRLMALEQWTFIWKFDHRTEKVYAECDARLDYRRTTISFNPAMMENEVDLITSLRHEMFHTVLACYNLYMEAVDELLTDDSPEAKILGRIWTHVIEQGVVNLELMWERLRNEPRA